MERNLERLENRHYVEKTGKEKRRMVSRSDLVSKPGKKEKRARGIRAEKKRKSAT